MSVCSRSESSQTRAWPWTRLPRYFCSAVWSLRKPGPLASSFCCSLSASSSPFQSFLPLLPTENFGLRQTGLLALTSWGAFPCLCVGSSPSLPFQALPRVSPFPDPIYHQPIAYRFLKPNSNIT